ncbi:MAG: hypothetical protein J1F35_08755 [Erysipelotrichales bacterium]|nr:hypothetical protein [Erysipelotrichales bacterium]
MTYAFIDTNILLHFKVFEGIKWDIIIKSYRKKLGSKSFENVVDYVNDFIEYLKKEELSLQDFKILPKLLNQFINEAINMLIKKILPKPIGGNITIPSIQSFRNAIQKEIREIGLPQECRDIYNNCRKILSVPCSTFVLQLYPKSSNPTEISELEILIEQFVFALFLRQTSSQLVFVGYGDKEYFPNITSIWLYSSLNEEWKAGVADSQSISNHQNALICPFAQMEDMATLIEGINPALEKALQTEVGNTLNEFKQEILKEVADPSIIDKVSKIDIGNFVNRFRNICNLIKAQAYTRPLVSHLGQLEKEDLALLAENLIAITSLRKKVTMAPESVGGPIDVAVISKYDGVYLAKRKMYFDEKLNPQFRENYYRDCD